MSHSQRGCVIMAVPGKLVQSGASRVSPAGTGSPGTEEILNNSIDVDKPSTAHVEGISPQDFIFSLGLLFSVHVTPPHSSLTSRSAFSCR